MLPTERGDMFDHIRRRGDAFTIELGIRHCHSVAHQPVSIAEQGLQFFCRHGDERLALGAQRGFLWGAIAKFESMTFSASLGV